MTKKNRPRYVSVLEENPEYDDYVEKFVRPIFREDKKDIDDSNDNDV